AAARILSTVSTEIRRSTCRLFKTDETEPIETPASSATFRTVVRAAPFALAFFIFLRVTVQFLWRVAKSLLQRWAPCSPFADGQRGSPGIAAAEDVVAMV